MSAIQDAKEALEVLGALAAAYFRDGRRDDVPDETAVWGFNDVTLTAGDLRKAVTALASMDANGWMPIETAPKDELVVLACADWPHSKILGKPIPIKVGGWREDGHLWEVFGASWVPTHWQPLPKSPVVQP